MPLVRKVVLATLISLLAALPSSAQANPPPADEFFGANVQSLLTVKPFEVADWEPNLKLMAGMGLEVGRSNAPWVWVEPSAPDNGVRDYDWTRLDTHVIALAKQGIRWQPVVGHPPSWAKAPSSSLPDSSKDDFAAFHAAMAERYGPGGDLWQEKPSVPEIPVIQYGVWSEPNSTIFWQRVQDPAEYMEAYKLAREEVHKVDPKAEVLLKLGWQNFASWARGALETGEPVDGIGFDPYGLTAAATLDLIRDLRRVTRSVGRPGLPIYITEYGLPSSRLGNNGMPPEVTRAGTITLTAEALSRSDCTVGNFIVYSLVEPETNPNNHEHTMGILARNGQRTTTGTAYRDANVRFRQTGPDASLPVCADTTTVPREQLLPLGLVLHEYAPECFRPVVDYRGFPMEDATVFVTTARPRWTGQVSTNRNGEARFCLENIRRNGGAVWAEVPRAASSRVIDLGDPPPVLPAAAPSGDEPPVISAFRLLRTKVPIDLRTRRQKSKTSVASIAATPTRRKKEAKSKRCSNAKTKKKRKGRKPCKKATPNHFRYMITEPARVRIRIRRLRGQRRKKACRTLRLSTRRCRRVRMSGEFGQNSILGFNKVGFKGLIRRRALAPGSYTAVITAVDSAGNRAAPRRVRFKVSWKKPVKKKKKASRRTKSRNRRPAAKSTAWWSVDRTP